MEDTAGMEDMEDTADMVDAAEKIGAQTIRVMRATETTTGTRTTPFIHDSSTHLFNKGESVMLNTKLITWALGLFTTISYVICVIFGLVTPESLHMHQFLEIVLPAFEWLSFGSFLLGLVESFLWGVYTGLVFPPIYNVLYRRWSTSGTA